MEFDENLTHTSRNTDEEGNTLITKSEIDIVDGFVYKPMHTIETFKVDMFMNESGILEKCYACKYCGLICKTEFAIKEHMKKHPAKTAYECSLCEILYSTSSDFHKHLRRSHRDKTQQQSENKSMKIENTDDADEVVDLIEEINTPEMEEVGFIDEAPEHFQENTDDADEVVDLVEEINTPETEEVGSIDEAIEPILARSPAPNNLFKCRQCKYPFGRPDFDRKNSRPFFKNSNLTFYCNKCNGKFKSNAFMLQHLTTHHHPLRCHFCHGAFTTKYSINNHSNRIHRTKPRTHFKPSIHKRKQGLI